MHRNLLVDIDNTVCVGVRNEEIHLYATTEVLDGAVEFVNGLYDAVNTITFFTSREEKDRQITLTWLHKHGFKFHGLIMDKPRFGNYCWIDDLDVKAVKFQGDYKEILTQLS